jgi:predicted protein tyrosine phosphatase
MVVPVVQCQYDDISKPILLETKLDGHWMTIDDARKIVKFLLEVDKKEGTTVVLVNCMAGISRSGAVATFIKTVWDLDDQDFRLLNPNIHPNSHNLSLLFKAFYEPKP